MKNWWERGVLCSKKNNENENVVFNLVRIVMKMRTLGSISNTNDEKWNVWWVLFSKKSNDMFCCEVVQKLIIVETIQ